MSLLVGRGWWATGQSVAAFGGSVGLGLPRFDAGLCAGVLAFPSGAGDRDRIGGLGWPAAWRTLRIGQRLGVGNGVGPLGIRGGLLGGLAGADLVEGLPDTSSPVGAVVQPLGDLIAAVVLTEQGVLGGVGGLRGGEVGIGQPS